MEENSSIIDRLRVQLETATEELDSARTELENIIECFITDIRDNSGYYVKNNIRREIKKTPSSADSLDDEKAEAMAGELEQAVEGFLETALPQIRDYRGWRDEDTVFIDTKSYLWRAVKGIEGSVNRILRKYGLNPIDMKNWTWLSMETNELITTRFTESKKNFLDKRKHHDYLRTRFTEEQKVEDVFDKLDRI